MGTSTRILRAGLAVAVAVVLGLTGCGSSSESSAAASARRRAAHPQHSAPTSIAPTDMVAAVSAGKAGPPVDLRFELRESPQAGQVLDVDIALLPDAPSIGRIYAKFHGGEGLDLVEGGELDVVEKPAQGAVIRHVVRVLPKQDGIFTVGATVSVDLADDSIVRTYVIPVIVGEGIPEQTAKAAVADGQATGTGLKKR
jgi:hypothetical protein